MRISDWSSDVCSSDLIAAGAVVLYFDDETNGGFGLITLALLAGAAGGSFWAAITAWLRDRYNANEILVSLMLVYIAQLLLSYLVQIGRASCRERVCQYV